MHINYDMKTGIILFTILFLVANTSFGQTKNDIAELKQSVEENLIGNILPFWTDNSVDPTGGFYGVVIDKDCPIANASKGAILNARILWTFSRAYCMTNVEHYRSMADRAAEYYISHFIDAKYGGVFWLVDSEGRPKDMTKQTYAAAFGVYGLAEHFHATGDTNSLEAAKNIYHIMEEKTHDKARKGYIETFKRNYKPTSQKGVDGMKGATKTMNTHIHILEAYTALYKVWPNEELKINLRELIGILQHELYSPATKHLILFCDNEWNSIGQVDSYGHDIETSWLMTEAAEVLGDTNVLEAVKKQAVEMVDVALAEGLNVEGAMIYEKVGDEYRKDLSWWPQCEAIVGCINAWQITGNKKYFDAATRVWNYAKCHFVDNSNGGWFKALTADGKPKREPKVSMWNCPYHNSRMAFELSVRLFPFES